MIEPGARSVQTYKNVKRLAEDLGVKKVRVVANKVRGTEDEEFGPLEDSGGRFTWDLSITTRK